MHSPTAGRGETVGPEPEKAGDDNRAILDALPAMVGYWDAGLRNRMANGAYVEFFGLTPEQIHGRHASEVLGPELYALNRPSYRASTRG